MADSIRIRSTAPVAFRVSELHPDPEHPGNSPALKQAVIRPGVSTLSGDELVAYQAWAGTEPTFITDGTVSEMAEDDPEMEFGLEVALKKAIDEAKGASDGSTVTDPGPVKASDMRPGSPDAVSPAPALASTAPLKVPVTSEAPAAVPAAKVAPPAPITK